MTDELFKRHQLSGDHPQRRRKDQPVGHIDLAPLVKRADQPDCRVPFNVRAYLVKGTLYLFAAFGVGAVVRAILYLLGV